jgi:hypothetical protein
MIISCSETLPIIPLEPLLHLINSKKAGVSRPDTTTTTTTKPVSPKQVGVG